MSCCCTGDVITLYNPAGEVRSSVEYSTVANQASWSLVGTTWEWSTGTPGSANVAPTDSAVSGSTGGGSSSGTGGNSASSDQTSADVHLSELLPNPVGLDTTDEWIEVVNDGSTSVSLHNWQLTDQTTYYTIGNVGIAPGEYMVFEIGDTRINLNNTGDTVYVMDPFGKIISGTQYTKSTEGPAWARNGDTWEWTTTPTPGEANAFAASAAGTAGTDSGQSAVSGTTGSGSGASGTSGATNVGAGTDTSEQTTVTSISDFRSLDDAQSGTIEGVVTALPNVFGTQYLYIQDDTAGIQVYSYNKAFPTLDEGDRVRITGEKSSSRGETRIKTTQTSDIVVVGHDETVSPLDVSSLAEEQEGMLVQIEGDVVSRTGSNVTVNDNLLVVIKAGSAISSSVFTIGAHMSVVGVVGQSDDSYRVMPRSSADITPIEADSSAWIQPAQAATTSTASSAPTSGGTPAGASQSPLALVALLSVAGVVLAARYVMWHRKQKLAPLMTPVQSPQNVEDAQQQSATPTYLLKQ